MFDHIDWQKAFSDGVMLARWLEGQAAASKSQAWHQLLFHSPWWIQFVLWTALVLAAIETCRAVAKALTIHGFH